MKRNLYILLPALGLSAALLAALVCVSFSDSVRHVISLYKVSVA